MDEASKVSDQQLVSKFGNMDALFKQADSDNDNIINPNDARTFFPRFNLPNPVLSSLWNSSVSNPSVGMSRSDFTKAMKHVYVHLNKVSTNTNTSSATPSPNMFARASPSPAPSPNSMLGSTQDPSYIISEQEKTSYEKHFFQLTKGQASTVSAKDASAFFLKSKLDRESLAKIWGLADLNKNGMLSFEGFCVAMYMIRKKVRDRTFVFPSQAPPSLLNSLKSNPSSGTTLTSNQIPVSHSSTNSSTSMGSMGMSGGMGSMGNSMGGMSSGRPLNASSIQPQGSGAQLASQRVQNLMTQTKQYTSDSFNMQNQIKEDQQKLEILKKQEKELENEIEQKKDEVDKFRREKNVVEGQISSYETRMNILMDDKSSLQSDIDKLQEEIDRLSSIKSDKNSNYDEMKETNDKLENELNGLVDKLVAKKNEIENEVKSYESNVGNQKELLAKVEQLKLDMSKSNGEKRQLEQKNRAVQSQIDSQKKSISEYENAISANDKDTAQLKKQNESLEKQLEGIKSQLSEKESTYASSSSAQKSNIVKLRQMASNIVDLMQQFQKSLQVQVVEGLPSPSYNITPTSPKANIKTVPKNEPIASFNDDEFDEGFGFGNDDPKIDEHVESSQTNDFFGRGFENDTFGKANNNPLPVEATKKRPPPPPKGIEQQLPAEDDDNLFAEEGNTNWDDFDNNNSNITNAFEADGFGGFDDEPAKNDKKAENAAFGFGDQEDEWEF